MTFDDTFRETNRRRVGGGPKTVGAEEITFVGEYRGRKVTLISRVRLRNPLESFMTNSGHRLRDSQVGSGGHWIDMKVIGESSDAEIEDIGRLAREADRRPVIVRRAATLSDSRATQVSKAAAKRVAKKADTPPKRGSDRQAHALADVVQPADVPRGD